LETFFGNQITLAETTLAETTLVETAILETMLVKEFSFTCMGIGVERGRLLASLHPPPINVRKPVVCHHIFGTVSSWKAKLVS
jgi:hypothetical protein